MAILSPNFSITSSLLVVMINVITIAFQIATFKAKVIQNEESGASKLYRLFSNCLFPLIMCLLVIATIASYRSSSLDLNSPIFAIPYIFAFLSIASLLALTMKALVPFFQKHQVSAFQLIEVITTIFSIIGLFAAMFALIFIIDRSSFDGIRNLGITEVTVDFLYFSVATFTTLGFGDIHPVSTAAKICVALEPLVSALGISIVLVFFAKNIKNQEVIKASGIAKKK